MILERVDRNLHYRERRRRARRRRNVRRLVSLVVLVVAMSTAALFARGLPGAEAEPAASVAAVQSEPAPKVDELAPRPAPADMRGVHVTVALASLPGKLEEYLAMEGLNTLQLDIKDENGEVGFVPSSVPLATRIGAARPYYKPRVVARLARAHDVYLVGRIVCFEDPVLSAARPDLAVQRPDGTRWVNHGGLGWTSPYLRETWEYLVDLAVAAAKTGFDEIQFDYVRFPTDGDMSQIVFPGQDATPAGDVIAGFLEYASGRLRPLGVRISADVFGLAATRDLGIGQRPRRLAPYLDAIYPMVYPSHYGPGEHGLEDPAATPGATVAASLSDFNRSLAGTGTAIVPWLQDFSYGREYGWEDVKAQIDAAYAMGSPGFLLWNASGLYTAQALTYRPTLG